MPTHDDTARPWSLRRHAELVDEVLTYMASLFHLDFAVGGSTLGDVMAERLQRLATLESPCWGMTGELTQIAEESSPALRFLYRPHLMPEMSDPLRLAHQLQYDLLPREVPGTARYRISAMLESYCHLSGDVLGWRTTDDGFSIWIADVSGHGVRAGLAAAVFYLLAADVDPALGPADAAERLGAEFLAARNPADPAALYVTAFLARLDDDGRGGYASAGHPPMFVRRRGGVVEPLPATGLPLGMFPSARMEEAALALELDEFLLLFTDGIVEAEDARGREIGTDWLERVLAECAGDPESTMAAIDREIFRRTDRSVLEDDMTYLIAKRSDAA